MMTMTMMGTKRLTTTAIAKIAKIVTPTPPPPPPSPSPLVSDSNNNEKRTLSKTTYTDNATARNILHHPITHRASSTRDDRPMKSEVVVGLGTEKDDFMSVDYGTLMKKKKEKKNRVGWTSDWMTDWTIDRTTDPLHRHEKKVNRPTREKKESERERKRQCHAHLIEQASAGTRSRLEQRGLRGRRRDGPSPSPSRSTGVGWRW